MIEFKNVTLRYHYEQYNLFENLSFTLTEGVNTILCDIQSGKSSLCKMILGEVCPNEGQVIVNGVNLFANGKPPIINALYLPANPTFFENKTVRYNLEYPLRVRKQLSQNADKVVALAEEYGIETLLLTKVNKLDARQKKLLALARGRVISRDIVLLDGFLDDTENTGVLSRESILGAFQCKTVVILTAKPSLAVGHTVVIDDKKCVYSGESDGAQEVIKSLMWLATRNLNL